MNRGAAAEDQACSLLQARGLDVLARNYRCRLGEIDLIMNDADTLVFVEVRARRAGALVSAADSVAPSKQRRLVAAARQFLGCHPQHAERQMRFDLLTIDGAQWHWERDVIQSDG